MNKILLIGRLTKDPETRNFDGEKKVSRFTLAVDRMKKGEADFIQIVAFGKTAEIVESYAKKGSLVAVDGSIRTGSYDDKDGKKVYTTDVTCHSIKLLNGGNSKAENNAEENNNFNNLSESFEEDFTPISDDDMPF